MLFVSSSWKGKMLLGEATQVSTNKLAIIEKKCAGFVLHQRVIFFIIATGCVHY